MRGLPTMCNGRSRRLALAPFLRHFKGMIEPEATARALLSCRFCVAPMMEGVDWEAQIGIAFAMNTAGAGCTARHRSCDDGYDLGLSTAHLEGASHWRGDCEPASFTC
jgi:hypothetical protein